MPSCPLCGTDYPPEQSFCTRDGQSLTSTVKTTERIGLMVGNYQIKQKKSDTLTGELYEALHPLLQRSASIKLISPQYASDPDTTARFMTEAKRLAQVRHRAIVEVYDIGTLDDGSVFLALEQLEGETLQDRLKRGPLSAEEARYIFSELAAGLSAIHSAGLIHRDLKPSTIFLVGNGKKAGNGESGIGNGEKTEGTTSSLYHQSSFPVPKLLDFAMAKPEGQKQTQTALSLEISAYHSPEQAMGKPLTASSDLYSFGLVLYEALAGVPPFEEGTPAEERYQKEPPKPSERAGKALDPELEAIVLRCLAKEPEARFESALSLREALLPKQLITPAPTIRQETPVAPPTPPKKIDLVRLYQEKPKFFWIGAAVLLLPLFLWLVWPSSTPQREALSESFFVEHAEDPIPKILSRSEINGVLDKIELSSCLSNRRIKIFGSSRKMLFVKVTIDKTGKTKEISSLSDQVGECVVAMLEKEPVSFPSIERPSQTFYYFYPHN